MNSTGENIVKTRLSIYHRLSVHIKHPLSSCAMRYSNRRPPA
jgi:hypothetical protein